MKNTLHGRIAPIFTIIAMLSISILRSAAHAETDITLPTLSVNPTEGENFDIIVGVDPNGIVNYTTKVELDYPADLLEVKSFDFGHGWMQLVQPGHDRIDNESGVIIKTAGNPDGSSRAKTFGTISFEAKKSGTGVITVSENSFSLDGNNQNILSEAFSGTGIIITQEHFVDITEHWSKEFVEDLYLQGIVSGYDEFQYGPDNKITRAEFTKIVAGAFDTPIFDISGIEEMAFSDVDIEDWYAPYIRAAFTNKIISGYEDGTFRPNNPINRAEALKILLGAAGIDIETEYNTGFSDVDLDAWYAPYVNYAAEHGIVSGYTDGTFHPEKNLIRGEVAKIVSLTLDNI